MNGSPSPAGDRAALVVGAGDAIGGAIARRFAREGLIACVSRRSAAKMAPLVVIDGAFFGQDRLQFVEQALRQA